MEAADACSEERAMGDHTAKITAHIAASLEPGEVVLGAASAAPTGTMRAMAHGDGGLRGRRISSPYLENGRAQFEIFGIDFALQYVVVLTDRRFLFFRTNMFGRPKGLAGAVTRGEIDRVALGSGIALGQRFGAFRVTRTDGRAVTFEVARLHLPRATDLVERFGAAAAA
jgi:hypothetical protein